MNIMKVYAPPHLLSTLLLFAAPYFHAATVRAQATGRMASPTLSAARDAGPRARRIAALRASNTPGGSHITVTSDDPLSDYSAYRRGEDFCVRIPQAEADGAQQPVGGRGFTAARVESAGDDLLLTFRLEAGASARVNQNFNRLDILFMSGKGAPEKNTKGMPEKDTSEGSSSAALPSGADASATSAPDAAASKDSQPTTQAASAGGASQEDLRMRQLLKRVEELEARVRELEAKQPNATNEAEKTSGANANVNKSSAATSKAEEKGSVTGGQRDDEHASGEHAGVLPTGTPRMQIQGYADVNFLASDEKGRTTSFNIGQIDLFVTSRLSENLSVLGELVLEAQEDNSFTFTAHRLLLRYAPRDYFTLGVGRDHTAIGYYNTAYHHGSWFQTAATRPYLFAFENKGGILPLHNVGVSVSGRIPSAPFGLHYVAEIGNGRSVNKTPDRSVATAVDENNGKAFNLALFARPPRLPGFQTGFSVYRDRRTPAGAGVVGETIMAAHLVYRSPRNELLNEGVLVRHATGARVFYTPGFYTQFAHRFGDARPYFRYQYVNAPDGDPIFQPLGVGRRNGPSLGLRYDVSEFAAFKFQFDRTLRRRENALDELILQLAFTF